jgi:hypothetical protein
MAKPFTPRVTRTKNLLSAPVLAWAQAQADAAYGEVRLGEDGMETAAVEICAANDAVAPHVDAEGKEGMDLTGMRIFGLVIRSDGHRLHTDALHAAGVTEGLPLAPGDVYEIDVFDRHWTSVPDGAVKPQIIFTVSIMRPDGRSHAKLGHDFMWTVLAASIESMRRDRAA